MGTEIELKLELDPRHVERLRRHPVLKAARQGRATAQRLVSVYFDTPRHHLHKGGASLRVRHIGKRRVLGLKSPATGGGGHLHRQEFEAEITGDLPDDATLRAAGADAWLGAKALAALAPVFTTRFSRSSYRVADGAWEIALTLDKGEVATDGASAPLCEAELELTRGAPVDLYRLARSLAADLPLHVSLTSKADRGYSLASGTPPDAVKAPPLMLAPTMSAADTFQSIGRACLQHLLLNAPVLRARRMPEAVHQMRVALRRLRSAMTLFRPLVGGEEAAALLGEIKDITGVLGAARDLDVFMADVLAPVVEAAPTDAGLAALHATIGARRQAAYARAVETIDSRRFACLVLDIGVWLEGGAWLRTTAPDLRDRPVAEAAADILHARHRKVLKAGRRFGELDAEGRHRLRIHIKRLRYAVEFFASLYSRKKARAFAKRLARAQDALGHLNDLAVAEALLHEVADAAPAAAFAAGRVAGWHQARLRGPDAAGLAPAAAAWKAVTKAKPFWE